MARAQNKSGWTCSETWKYDMTVIAVVTYNNGSPVADQSNYEIGAFVGTECRGVADGATDDLVTVGSNKVFYLRVRSENASGENVTFKVYDKEGKSELSGLTFTPVTFSSDATIGKTDAPFALKRMEDPPYVLGDADGDGVVDLTDAVAIFEFYMGEDYPGFVEAAADFDGDGTVDLTDAVLIFEYYMNQ